MTVQWGTDQFADWSRPELCERILSLREELDSLKEERAKLEQLQLQQLSQLGLLLKNANAKLEQLQEQVQQLSIERDRWLRAMQERDRQLEAVRRAVCSGPCNPRPKT